MTTNETSIEAVSELWLLDNRCPWCVHGDNCDGHFKRRETSEGWQCFGYRSKYLSDERWSPGKSEGGKE